MINLFLFIKCKNTFLIATVNVLSVAGILSVVTVVWRQEKSVTAVTSVTVKMWTRAVNPVPANLPPMLSVQRGHAVMAAAG